MRYWCGRCRVTYTRRALVKRCLICAEWTCYRCGRESHRHSVAQQTDYMMAKREAERRAEVAHAQGDGLPRSGTLGLALHVRCAPRRDEDGAGGSPASGSARADRALGDLGDETEERAMKTKGSRLSADARAWGMKVYARDEDNPRGPYRAVCPCGWRGPFYVSLARAQGSGDGHYWVEHRPEACDECGAMVQASDLRGVTEPGSGETFAVCADRQGCRARVEAGVVP